MLKPNGLRFGVVICGNVSRDIWDEFNLILNSFYSFWLRTLQWARFTHNWGVRTTSDQLSRLQTLFWSHESAFPIEALLRDPRRGSPESALPIEIALVMWGSGAVLTDPPGGNPELALPIEIIASVAWGSKAPTWRQQVFVTNLESSYLLLLTSMGTVGSLSLL